MNNINTFDPSHSPSEKFEAVDRPDCLACGDTGTFVSADGLHDWCDCASGMAACEQASDPQTFEDEWEDPYTDAEADADTLASAGYGTDEDYGYYGEEY